MERKDYEKDLRRRQQRHLDSIIEKENTEWMPCLHDGCPDCLGTGRKHDGSSCIHMISCPCPKCSPKCLK